MDEKTWQKNVPSQIILNSIFAALVGVLIVTVIQDKIVDKVKFVELIILFVSFILFALSAEQTLNALDGRDIKKYVYYMLWYNIGVIFLGGSIGILIYAHFFESLVSNISPNHPTIILILFISFFFILLWRWIKDSWWLIFSEKIEFKEYLDELDDKKEAGLDYGCLMTKFFKFKGIDFLKNPYQGLPHNGVYVRLRPSPINGIGVFAIRDIPKGTDIFTGDNSKMIWINKSEIKNLAPDVKKLYDDFCIIKGDKYNCPENFNFLTVGWYLNESKGNPNVMCVDDYNFIAIKDIKSGEELLIDYSTYSDYPNN